MANPKKYNPYVLRGEHYIRTTASKVLMNFKIEEGGFNNPKHKKWVEKFNKLSFGEKIELLRGVILLQESMFKEYMATFKNYHVIGVGSFRELQDRRYCLKRSKELEMEFPDMPHDEIYRTLRKEILERRLEKKKLKNRKYLK